MEDNVCGAITSMSSKQELKTVPWTIASVKDQSDVQLWFQEILDNFQTMMLVKEHKDFYPCQTVIDASISLKTHFEKYYVVTEEMKRVKRETEIHHCLEHLENHCTSEDEVSIVQLIKHIVRNLISFSPNRNVVKSFIHMLNEVCTHWQKLQTLQLLSQTQSAIEKNPKFVKMHTLLLEAIKRFGENHHVVSESLVQIANALKSYEDYYKIPSSKSWTECRGKFFELNLSRIQNVPFVDAVKQLQIFIIHNHRCEMPPLVVQQLVSALIAALEQKLQLPQANAKGKQTEPSGIDGVQLPQSETQIRMTRESNIHPSEHSSEQFSSQENNQAQMPNAGSAGKKRVGKGKVNNKQSTTDANKSIDDALIKHLIKAKSLTVREDYNNLMPNEFVHNLIIMFTQALKGYVTYCFEVDKTKHSYDTALLSMKKIIFIGTPDENFIELLKVLEKIKNIIVHSCPEYYIPPPVILQEMTMLITYLGIMLTTWVQKYNTNVHTTQTSTLAGMQPDLDTVCSNLKTKISNLLKNGFKKNVPCEKTQTIVVQFMEVLKKMEKFSKGGNKKDWYELGNVLNKVISFDSKKHKQIDSDLLKLLMKFKTAVLGHGKQIPSKKVLKIIKSLCSTLETYTIEWSKQSKMTNASVQNQWHKQKINNPSVLRYFPSFHSPLSPYLPNPTCLPTYQPAMPSSALYQPPHIPHLHPTAPPTCHKNTQSSIPLIDLLKMVRDAADEYSGLPTQTLQDEMLDTVRHLQRCYSTWDKTFMQKKSEVPKGVKNAKKSDGNKTVTVENKSIKEQSPKGGNPIGDSVSFTTTPEKLVTLKKSRDLEYSSQKISWGNESGGKGQPKKGEIPIGDGVPFSREPETMSFGSDTDRKGQIYSPNFVSLQFDSPKAKVINAKTWEVRQDCNTETFREEKKSKETPSKIKNVGVKEVAEDRVAVEKIVCEPAGSKTPKPKKGTNYSEKLILSVPTLNDTINRYVFDEIFLNRQQIKDLRSAFECVSEDSYARNLQIFKMLLVELKSKKTLDDLAIADLDVLIREFENVLVEGNEKNIQVSNCSRKTPSIELSYKKLQDVLQQANDRNLSANESYLKRFNSTLDLTEELNTAPTCDLLKFEENTIGFFASEEIKSNEILDETSSNEWSDVSSDYEEEEEEENNFTITRDGNLLVIELYNALDEEFDSNAVFPVRVRLPDDETIDLTNKALREYNAFMILSDDSEEKVILEFPNVSKFLLFAQENQDIVERLDLVSHKDLGSKKQASLPSTVPNKLKRESLDVKCTHFLRSDESIAEQVNHLLNTFKQCHASSRNIEKSILQDLGKVLAKVYPKHVLYTFGSRATGQALPDSDFDIYCDITGTEYVTGCNHTNQMKIVSKVASDLRRQTLTFSKVLALTKTKVPIAKLFHKPTQLNCDVSFKDGTSVENTHLLNVYLSLDPRVSWVLAAVKLWAHYNQLQGSSYFTSHGLSWLVLFYLMQTRVVPPVMELQGGRPKIINNWDVSFQRPNQWSPSNQVPALRLFKQFFAWIAQSDVLSSHCLCTLTGEAIPKSSIEKISWLKQYKNGVFKKYAERLQMKRTPSRWTSSYDMIETNGSTGLCVQDPFEHSKNVTRPVRNEKYANFLRLAKQTDSILN